MKSQKPKGPGKILGNALSYGFGASSGLARGEPISSSELSIEENRVYTIKKRNG